MTQPRSQQICLDATPFYHITSRCVRRAFLCGVDHYSGQNFEHRRAWVVDRLELLTSVFCIDLCAYAIMSNHYHLVLCVDKARALALSDDAVVAQWTALHKGPPLMQRYQAGEKLSGDEHKALARLVATYRKRLHSISHFMAAINEYIARQGNREDGVKGRFWESRFHCQPILDEAALINTLVYVDLNPIRAGIARTPEYSDFTSVQARIRAWERAKQQKQSPRKMQPALLVPLDDAIKATLPNDVTAHSPSHSIAIDLDDYLKLVDWSGRAIRGDKRGHIPATVTPILARLQTDPAHWLAGLDQRRRKRSRALGSRERLEAFCQHIKQRWCWGMSSAS